MRKLSETEIESLDKSETHLIEALEKMSLGAAKMLAPEDKFIGVNEAAMTFQVCSCAALVVKTLRELREFRSERGA